jgi:hypothetical protein
VDVCLCCLCAAMGLYQSLGFPDSSNFSAQSGGHSLVALLMMGSSMFWLGRPVPPAAAGEVAAAAQRGRQLLAIGKLEHRALVVAGSSGRERGGERDAVDTHTHTVTLCLPCSAYGSTLTTEWALHRRRVDLLSHRAREHTVNHRLAAAHDTRPASGCVAAGGGVSCTPMACTM